MTSYDRRWAIASILVAAAASSAQAATICVDPDDIACHATIQAGVDAAAAGDTVKIARGTYFESVLVPAGKDGLVLTGKAIIDAHEVQDPNDPVDPNAPYEPSAISAIRVQANDVTIEKLTIHNGRDKGIDFAADGLVVRQATILGPSRDCIYGFGSGTLIEKAELRGCGNDAIEISGDDSVIRKSKISMCDNDCINLDGTGLRIEHNTISQAEDGDCVELDGDGAAVIKNRIAHCDNDAVDIGGSSGLVSGNKMETIETGVNFIGDNATIEKNKVRFATDRCFEINGDSMIVTGNKARSCGGDGFELRGDGMTVSKNAASEADDNAFEVSCEPCSGGLLFKNKAELAIGDDDCFDIYALADPNDPENPGKPANFRIEGNSAKNCMDSGFAIRGNGITVVKNRAEDNGGDEYENGFDISGIGHAVEKNTAKGNFSTGFDVFGQGHSFDGNKALANLGDGFAITGSGHTFTGNSAVKNIGQGFAVHVDPNDPVTLTLTDNKASKNRTDFCDSSGQAVLSGNDFETTSAPCLDFD